MPETWEMLMHSIRDRKAGEPIEIRLPTDYGEFRLIGFPREAGGSPHLALVRGALDRTAPVLVRIHSECLTGDVFGSSRCDCGDQLQAALRQIASEGAGVLLYLRQEGRGIGLMNKLRAYRLQDGGLDTVDANEALGFAVDEREYSAAIAILDGLGVSKVRLLTNNPDKIRAINQSHLELAERVSLEALPGDDNARYLDTKRRRMGHLLKHPR